MKTRIVVEASGRESDINPMLYGHFIENMARCVYGGILRNTKKGRTGGPWELRGDLVRAAKKMCPPVVRWPGGLYADGYNWRDGVGPMEERPLRRNRYWSRFGPITRVLDPNSFGTKEFLDFCHGLGADPYINVNLGTGSALDAAKWVEYTNGGPETQEGGKRAEHGRKKPWSVRYWGIGNETYGVWAIGHSGPREYAARYMEFRNAMKEADRDLRFVAVGADRYLSKNWNREMLSEAGDKVDLMSIHIYLPGLERLPEVACSRAMGGASRVYRAIVAAPIEIEKRLRQARGDIEEVMGSGSEIKLALDEWNLWWKPSQLIRPRWTLRDALFVCGTFHALHRCSRFVEMANIAQMVNVLGILSASGERFYRSAMYFPFVIYREMAGETSVKTRTTCATFSSKRLGGIQPISDVPVLDCSATIRKKDGRLTLFVINRDMSEDVDATIDLKGFNPHGDVEIHCLNGPSVDAYNWYGNDRVVGVKESMSDPGEVLPRYCFPAHSLTAMAFESYKKNSAESRA